MKKLFRFFKYFLVVCLLLFLCLFLWLPNVAWLIKHNPESSAFIDAYKYKLESQGIEPTVQFIWMPLSKISKNLIKAVVTSEDDAFYSHHGFDFKQIKKAIKEDIKKRKFKRGASTITQQLVKNLYLGPSKSVFRKLREAIITFQMEMTLSKDRILEIYLNVAEWGEGVYGAEAASQFYFGKPAKNLTLTEAVYLTALLPNPIFLSKPENSKKLKYRIGLIQQRISNEW